MVLYQQRPYKVGRADKIKKKMSDDKSAAVKDAKKRTTIDDDYEMVETRVFEHFIHRIQAWHEPLFLTRRLVPCDANERPTRIGYHVSRDSSAYLLGDAGSSKRRYFLSDLENCVVHLAADDGVQTKLVAFYVYALTWDQYRSSSGCTLASINGRAQALFDKTSEEQWRQARFAVSDVEIFRRFSQLLRERSWRFETAEETKSRCLASTYISYKLTILRAASRPLLGFARSMIQQSAQVLRWMDIATNSIDDDDDDKEERRIDALKSLSEHVTQCLYEQAKVHFDGEIRAGYDDVKTIGCGGGGRNVRPVLVTALEDRN